MKFTRHEAGQKARIGSSWRRPKGHQNKMRLSKKGHKASISQGYRRQKSLRGSHKKTQLALVTIQNVKELEHIDPKTTAIIIGNVGVKKKLDIIKQAQDKNITITNIDPAKFEERVKQKKELKKQKDQQKKKKEEEKQADQKKAEKESQEDKDQADKQTKKQASQEKPVAKKSAPQEEKVEKKEQEKILHHKQ